MKSMLVLVCTAILCNAQQNADFVNPFIGTGGHGHTFPGPVMPFGMVQLSPDTRIDGSWDGCSGYHYSDTVIYGFSHTHLSGTGVSDWGDILLMPTFAHSADNKLYSNSFSHRDEQASAGYYRVRLRSQITSELTVTRRVGLHRYTCADNDTMRLVLDLLHRDKTLDCKLVVRDSVTVMGYRISEGWARRQEVYFAIKFSRGFVSKEFCSGKKLKKIPAKNERVEGALFAFKMKNRPPLIVKVAISPVSMEGALKNLESEAPGFDFDQYKMKAAEAWSSQLKKIEIDEPDTNGKIVFYTALYHSFIHPSLYMDVDGKYRGRDGKVHTAVNFENYSVFSLWDTYRALHPLLTLLERKRTSYFVRSFLEQYKQSGRLPVWELSGNETDCMIGFHAVSVMADAIVKGIGGIDTAAAYKAMKAAATYSAYGIPVFNRKGYLESNDEVESVSRTLEYAYDNWCVSQVARMLGHAGDEEIFSCRSLAFVNLFDPLTGFMRPRRNGGWLVPFQASDISNHFTEGNSWQYSFYVPHNVGALVRMHGLINFERKIDELFTTGQKLTGREQSDVTGLIGQYAHGNEPSHHMAYLYNYAGSPAKTVKQVSFIRNEFYRNAPDGLIGNEDCGQMSAWYVFNAMGLYPLCPGIARYDVSEPMSPRVKLNFEDGKTFTMESEPGNKKVIAGLMVNGKKTLRPLVDHSDLVSGGGMRWLYAESDGGTYAQGRNIPYTIASSLKTPAPLITGSHQVFADKQIITLSSLTTEKSRIIYSVNVSLATNAVEYSSPFEISATSTVYARSITSKDTSDFATATFFRLKGGRTITLLSEPEGQYSAEGPFTLMDGVYGNRNWRRGDWLGFQGKDLAVIADLQQTRTISKLGLDCLQDAGSWIIFPSSVEFFVSENNSDYKLACSISTTLSPGDLELKIKNFQKTLPVPVSARYVKIVARNAGPLPEWHIGKGNKSYIFVDELVAE